MIKLSKKTNNIIYSRISLIITIFVITTILVLSAILYFNFEKITLYKIYNSQMDSLNQISYSATFMTDTAKMLATQIFFDPEIKSLRDIPADNDASSLAALERLSIFHSSAPLINNIYVYNADTNTFYLDAGSERKKEAGDFFDKDIIGILKNFKNYEKMKPIPRKIPYFYSNNINKIYINVYTFVYYDLPGKSEALKNAVIINISEDWMKNIVKSVSANERKDIFIIDNNGKVVMGNENHEILSDVSGEPYLDKIMKSGKETGYFTEKINDQKSLVIYSSAGNLNWKYINIIPYNNILGQVKAMRSNTLLICFVILLLGIFVSIIISRIAYKPVNKIIDELTKMKLEKTKSNFEICQKVLQGLLLGQIELAAEDLVMKSRELGTGLPIEGNVMVILFRIDRYKEFSKTYNATDRAMLKYGIMNIGSEIFSCLSPCFVVDMNDDKIAVLINSEKLNSEEFGENVVRELITAAQKAVSQYLSYTITASFSDTGHAPEDISLLYNKALQASMSRLFTGKESIIETKVFDNQQKQQYELSKKDEKALGDAITANNFTQADAICKKIIMESSQFSYNSFYLCMVKCMIIVDTTVNNIQTASGISLNTDINFMVNNLSQIETLDEIISFFSNIFYELGIMLEKKHMNKNNEMVDSIRELIQKGYMNTELTIDSIAESIGKSSAYIGRTFKQLTSVTISEYLNNVRIEKSKELLAETSLSINEIVFKVGFINTNYFFTLFKKNVGVTPGDFRQSCSDKNYNTLSLK